MKIFVGCSSSELGNEDYNRVADKLGEWIAENGHAFVFEGCGVGLIGRIFRKVHGHGKIYAIQTNVHKRELNGLEADESVVLNTINQSKDYCTRIADVLVFIPGGIGTMDELISAIVTRLSGEHKNPILIVNENDFFGPLLEQLDKIYSEKIASKNVQDLYFVADSVESAIDELTEICGS